MMKINPLAVVCLGIVTQGFAQPKKPAFKPTDIYRIETLSDPAISPDEEWVAYSLSKVDSAGDKRISHIWMQRIKGTESIQLTHDSASAASPEWSPDGKYISFLSSRGSKNGDQVWLLDRRGGEAKKLTEIKGDIEEYKWSPDSKTIALIIKDPENNGREAPKVALPIVIDRYHFKQDIEGYLGNRHKHLYIYNVIANKLDTLTKGNTDETGLNWSPDGSRIAFVSNHTIDPEKNENTDIFTVAPVKNSTPQQLTTWKGHDVNPKWSPDGKYIAYLRSTSDLPYMMYDQDVLCLMTADGKNQKALTLLIDRPVSAPRWNKKADELSFLVSDDRRVYLSDYNVRSGKISLINKGDYGIMNQLTFGDKDHIIELTTPYHPAELYAVEKGNLRQLTHHQDWLQNIAFARVSGFSSVSKDGTNVNGLLYKFDSAGIKKPFILFIHGGPVWQDEFIFDETRQVLACAGFAVAGVNYRGSYGRGVLYSKAIFGDWGNKEVTDLLGAVDELVKRGIADPEHLGIGGWSYGAILTDYTIATDTRFKAASSGAGSALQTTVYGSDEYVLQYDTELGPPWKNQQKWIDISYPFFHADRIKTPVLFMSGLKDFNVPTAGSEQMYEALKSLNIPAQLILYPNQYHGISVPSYQVDRLERYIKWYNKYLK